MQFVDVILIKTVSYLSMTFKCDKGCIYNGSEANLLLQHSSAIQLISCQFELYSYYLYIDKH